MRLSLRIFANLVAPAAAMSALHSIWKVEMVADLPTGWAFIYLMSVLLPAWVMAEAFNQILIRIPSLKEVPDFLRYLVAVIPIPFLSHLWHDEIRATIVAQVDGYSLPPTFVPPDLGGDAITVLVINWLPWIIVWIGLKLLMDRLGWGLNQPTRKYASTPEASGTEEPDAEGDTGDWGNTELPSVLHRAGYRVMPKLNALQAQEHYVVIHTDSGEKIVRYRLSDAIEECHMIEGVRVHRSWWIAKHAMTEVRRRGRSVAVRLPSGEWVPVSLAAKEAVSEAVLKGSQD